MKQVIYTAISLFMLGFGGKAFANCPATVAINTDYTCFGVFINAVMPVSYDYAINPNGIKFGLGSGAPGSLTGGFWIRSNEPSIDRFMAVILKAKELDRQVTFEFRVDPAHTNTAYIKSIYFN